MSKEIQEPIIQLERVDVQLGGRIILQDINLSIQPGEFVVILGPNGAGKTTFLRLLLGLIQPASGSVRVLGQTPQSRIASDRLCSATSRF